MTWLEHITTYVVSLVGKGTTLSSSDLAVLQRWEAAGVPAEAACRAIRRTWLRRRPERSRRLSLLDCEVPPAARGRGEPPVTRREAEASSTASPPVDGRPAGAGDALAAWTPDGLRARLVEVAGAVTDELVKSVYRAVYRQARALPDAPLTQRTLSSLDDHALTALERALVPAQRSDARRHARSRARQLAGREAESAAVERLARVLLEEHYCETLGLKLPSDLLLERGEDGHDQGEQKRLPRLRE
jgi:hypothetical protein